MIPLGDTGITEPPGEEPIDLELCWEMVRGPTNAPAASDVPALGAPTAPPLVSELNAEAKLFIPPYDRYRKYRALAQIEEIKEYKDKEAKIAALGKGNELIKSEVLIKLQQAKSQFECYEGKEAEASPPFAALPPPPAVPPAGPAPSAARDTLSMAAAQALAVTAAEVKAQRKRKMMMPAASLYKYINYRKFYDDSEKARRQPKMKFKKQK